MKTKTIHRIITGFLAAWLAWVEQGAPSGGIFNKLCGLCSNLGNYIIFLDLTDADAKEVKEVFDELLIQSCGNRDTPFNKGWINYASCEDHTKNLKRIAWAKKTLRELQETA